MAHGSSPDSEMRYEAPTFSGMNIDVEAGRASGAAEAGLSGAGQAPSALSTRLRPSYSLDIYLGSYAQTASHGSIAARPRSRTPPATPRESASHVQLEHLLPHVDVDLDTYGVEELRDGFFDAAFYRPLRRHRSSLMRRASKTLPQSFEKSRPLSVREFIPQQLCEVKGFLEILRTRAGIKLLKSFLGVLVAYSICLIPASRDWLGRYNYIIVISAIFNHPGRAVGSQVDGAFLTVLGTVAGLGWGSLALYVSTSTRVAQIGFGGVLATFLVFFTASIGWLRCVLIRFYQAVISAGIAICYTCLASTSDIVSWRKVFDYGIPWAFGQAICLVVALLVFPTAGARSFGLAIHDSLQIIGEGIRFPRQESQLLKRNLALQFVKLSNAVRDFTIDFTFSRFPATDVPKLRNLLQAVIRSVLAIDPDTQLFKGFSTDQESLDSADMIRWRLSEPTRVLITAMKECVYSTDATILWMAGLDVTSIALKPTSALSETIPELVKSKQIFDEADALLVNDEAVSTVYQQDKSAVELFLFVHPVRQAADNIEALAKHVHEMQQKSRGWRIQAPSYPWWKAIMRTNAQVRHDRGGLTAGFYFRAKNQLDRTMADLQSRPYVPAVRHGEKGKGKPDMSVLGENNGGEKSTVQTLRYKLWQLLHHLQGFESRFAFKVTLATTLLSIPAWLSQSRGWWNANESWWAVVTVWLMMHPRVGGTLQDLLVRCFCAILGATWGGLAYRAGNGNPYVMSAFAATFLIPMLYRFTQSSHPRSGFIGCVTFTVTSLCTYTNAGIPSTVAIAWTRGLAFVVGIIAAIIVNWILWPFVARHELRKSLSAMMLHSAILYRGVIAKYIYYAEGEEPEREDMERSEMLEGRLREGFVRMRELLELTRHEVRLRGPFNPLPYSALISACESLFEHLVQVRQSSLYFQFAMPASTLETVDSLTSVRRDAVAVILMNLYILACALRADRPVPRYLPSAAAARKKLLDRMDVLEAGHAANVRAEVVTAEGQSQNKKRRWADVYRYAYSSALTNIVEELQQLQQYTKEICGEVVWG